MESRVQGQQFVNLIGLPSLIQVLTSLPLDHRCLFGLLSCHLTGNLHCLALVKDLQDLNTILGIDLQYLAV